MPMAMDSTPESSPHPLHVHDAPSRLPRDSSSPTPQDAPSRLPQDSSSCQESSPDLPQETYLTTNTQKVRFQLGDYVVIGNDIAQYDIAKVTDINDPSCPMRLLQVTYFKPDLKKQELKVCLHFRKPWTDTCPMNSVIMSLGKNPKINKDILQDIVKLTEDIYA